MYHIAQQVPVQQCSNLMGISFVVSFVKVSFFCQDTPPRPYVKVLFFFILFYFLSLRQLSNDSSVSTLIFCPCVSYPTILLHLFCIISTLLLYEY